PVPRLVHLRVGRAVVVRDLHAVPEDRQRGAMVVGAEADGQGVVLAHDGVHALLEARGAIATRERGFPEERAARAARVEAVGGATHLGDAAADARPGSGIIEHAAGDGPAAELGARVVPDERIVDLAIAEVAGVEVLVVHRAVDVPVVELVVADRAAGVAHQHVVPGAAEEHAVSGAAEQDVVTAGAAAVGHRLHVHRDGGGGIGLRVAGGVGDGDADVLRAIGRDFARGIGHGPGAARAGDGGLVDAAAGLLDRVAFLAGAGDLNARRRFAGVDDVVTGDGVDHGRGGRG